MAHQIFVSSHAKRDILETANYIAEHGSPERAISWKNGVLVAIRSLAEMPDRCSIADESTDLGITLRDLHYHSHRVVFRVREEIKIVEILRVYHSARASLSLEDLE